MTDEKLMKNTASVKINGESKEVPFAFVGSEEVIQSYMGLISNPTDYKVTWKLGTREGRLLPSEKMTVEDGMEFTISRR